jgi:hypothetical protein
MTLTAKSEGDEAAREFVSYYDGPAKVRARANAASPRQVLMLALALIVSEWESTTSRNTWRRPNDRDRRYLTALIGWGYKPSDVERRRAGPGQRRRAGPGQRRRAALPEERRVVVPPPRPDHRRGPAARAVHDGGPSSCRCVGGRGTGPGARRRGRGWSVSSAPPSPTWPLRRSVSTRPTTTPTTERRPAVGLRIEWLPAGDTRVEPVSPADLQTAARRATSRATTAWPSPATTSPWSTGACRNRSSSPQRVIAGVQAIRAHQDAALRVEERRLEPQPQQPGLLGGDSGGAGPGQVP